MANESYSIVQYLKGKQPLDAQYILRRSAIARASTFFQRAFPGTIAYAVKTNSHPEVLTEIYQSGICQFDVASIEEIKLVRSLYPTARLFYMHTVKALEWIQEAYFKYGVRDFAYDSIDELTKIQCATQGALDLHLHLRIAISNDSAAIRLAQKFGAAHEISPSLLKKGREIAKKIGVCFHVGSQCMDPKAYQDAISICGDIISKAQVSIDSFDVGGGFPSVYPNMQPPNLQKYTDIILSEFKKLKLPPPCELIAEPGRALVAESGAVLVRVLARKDHFLYINDGTYGTLFDAGILGFIYPTRLIRTNGKSSLELAPFSFYGPTCDSIDQMKGPFHLPADTQVGDYIEIGQLGAYGLVMRTHFNGFFTHEIIETHDPPLMSYYANRRLKSKTQHTLNLVA